LETKSATMETDLIDWVSFGLDRKSLKVPRELPRPL